MKTMLWLVCWALAVVITYYAAGWWALIPGIGCPALYIAAILLSEEADLREVAHRTIMEIVHLEKVQARSHMTAVVAADTLGTPTHDNRCILRNTEKGLLGLSNKSLGRFLAHLLHGRDCKRIFRDVADSLQKHRPDSLTEILDHVKNLDAIVASKIEEELQEAVA